MKSLARANPLPARTGAVLCTYLRPWPLFFAMLVLASSIVPVYLATCVMYASPLMKLALADAVFMAIAVVSMTVIFHLRGQLDDARSALTPGFRAPHFIAASLVLAALNLLTPLVPYFLIGPANFASVAYHSYFAYTIMLSALLAWTCYEPFGVFVLIAVVVNLFPLDLTIVDGYPERTPFVTPVIACIFIGIAIAALVLLFTIYARFNGEGSEKISSLNFRFRARAANSRIGFRAGPLTLFIGKCFLFLQSRLDLLHARNFTDSPPAPASAALPPSFLARVQRRRRATFFGISPIFAGFLATLTSLLIFLLGSLFSDSPGMSPDIPPFFFIVPIVFFIALVSILFPKHWLYLPAESLLPATRAQFVREIGAALALDFFLFWLAATLSAVLTTLLLAPAAAYHPLNPLLIYPFLTAIFLTFSFGLIFWSMLFRNAIISTIASFISGVGIVCAISFVANGAAAGALLFLALLGLLLATHAYHRWLRIDLA